MSHAVQLMAAFHSPAQILPRCELVKRTKLSRGIVYRLLYTLERQVAVEKIGKDQYRLMYRRIGRHKWKIGYGTPGIESLRLAADACEEIELLMLDHRYKPAVTLRDADQFIREHVDLVIEYQIDEQVRVRITIRQASSAGDISVSGRGASGKGSAKKSVEVHPYGGA